MDYLDLVQWPAMLVTVAAAYLVGSRSGCSFALRRLISGGSTRMSEEDSCLGP